MKLPLGLIYIFLIILTPSIALGDSVPCDNPDEIRVEGKFEVFEKGPSSTVDGFSSVGTIVFQRVNGLIISDVSGLNQQSDASIDLRGEAEPMLDENGLCSLGFKAGTFDPLPWAVLNKNYEATGDLSLGGVLQLEEDHQFKLEKVSEL